MTTRKFRRFKEQERKKTEKSARKRAQRALATVIVSAALAAGSVASYGASVQVGGYINPGWGDTSRITNAASTSSTGVNINTSRTNTINDTLTISSQSGSKSILEWDSLSIRSGNYLNFQGAHSIYLNKVTGSDPSVLAGTLNAPSSTVIIVNPNGLTVSGTATINVGNFMLSTARGGAFTLTDANALQENVTNSIYDNAGPMNKPITIDAPISAAENLRLQAFDITIHSPLTAGDDLMIEGTRSVTATEDLTADEDTGKLTINSPIINVEGELTANELVINTTNDLELNTDVNKVSITGDADITLTNEKSLIVNNISTDDDSGEIDLTVKGDVINGRGNGLQVMSASDIEIKTSGQVGTEDNKLGFVASSISVTNLDGESATDENIYLKSYGTGVLSLGNILAGSDDEDVVIEAEGAVGQNDRSTAIVADEFSISAKGQVLLDNEKNSIKELGDVNVDVINGVGDGSFILTDSRSLNQVGDITTAGDVNINVTSGSYTLAEGRRIDAGAGNAEVIITADDDVTISESSAISADDVILTAREGKMDINGNITATNDEVVLTAKGDVTLGEDSYVTGADVSVVSTDGSIDSEGVVAATNGPLSFEAGKNIEIEEGTSASGTDVEMTAGENIDVYGTVFASRNADFTAGDNITVGYEGEDGTISGSIMAGGEIDAEAGENITVLNSILSLNGPVELSADNNVLIENEGVVRGLNVSIAAGNDLEVEGTVTADPERGTLTLQAEHDVTLEEDSVVVGGDVNVIADNDVYALGAITANAEVGQITIAANEETGTIYGSDTDTKVLDAHAISLTGHTIGTDDNEIYTNLNTTNVDNTMILSLSLGKITETSGVTLENVGNATLSYKRTDDATTTVDENNLELNFIRNVTIPTIQVTDDTIGNSLRLLPGHFNDDDLQPLTLESFNDRLTNLENAIGDGFDAGHSVADYISQIIGGSAGVKGLSGNTSGIDPEVFFASNTMNLASLQSTMGSLEDQVGQVTIALAQERSDRIAADSELQASLSEVQGSVEQVASNLAQERSDRIAADESLSGEVSNVSSAVESVASNLAKVADTSGDVAVLNQTLRTYGTDGTDGVVVNAIPGLINDVATALSSEASRAILAEGSLGDNLAALTVNVAKIADTSGDVAIVNPTLQTSNGTTVESLPGLINDVATALSSETERATGAEASIGSNLTDLTANVAKIADTSGDNAILNPNVQTSDGRQLSTVLADASVTGSILNTAQASIDQETSARQAADTALQANMDKIANTSGSVAVVNPTLQTSDGTTVESLPGQIGDVRTLVQVAQGGVDALTINLNNEIGRATQAEADLGTRIDAEAQRAVSAEDTIASNLAKVADTSGLVAVVNPTLQTSDGTTVESLPGLINDVSTALASETERATGAEASIGSNLTDLTANVAKIADTSGDNAILNPNVQTSDGRQLSTVLADASVTGSILNTAQASIDQETSARQAADTALQGNIDQEAATRLADDTALQAADTTLQANIDKIADTSGDTAILRDTVRLSSTKSTTIADVNSVFDGTALTVSSLTATSADISQLAAGSVTASSADISGQLNAGSVTASSATVSGNDVATVNYVDTATAAALSTATSYADQVAASTLSEANSYADQVAASTLSSATSYADQVASSTLSEANSYADQVASTARSEALSAAASYTDQVASSTLSEANSYADQVASTARSEAISAAASYTDQVASTTLSEANSYADQVASTAKSEAISEANSYADQVASTAKSEAISEAETLATQAKNDAISYTDSVLGGSYSSSNTVDDKISSIESQLTNVQDSQGFKGFFQGLLQFFIGN